MDCKKENDVFRIEWNDRPIVRVLGTVMTRDDTLGGWVPYMNGGQSKIGIHESMDKRRFRIYGWRMSDRKVTLDCLIQRNMVFHETIGTFHHWKVGEKKMGLTFYTPAEARSFNRGVRCALEQLSRIPEYASSSASSMCSRLSDEHPSSCTSPASSTGSSSPSEQGAFSSRKAVQEGYKKHSTSSASSSSSRHGTRRRRSPTAKPGKPSRAAHNSTSSCTSTQNRSHTHHAVKASVATAAPTLSLLSTAPPRFCDTPSTCDVSQSHFRWPLPQQQGYTTTLTFLNRPLPKEGSTYELTSFPVPSHPPSATCRDGEVVSLPKPQAQLPGTEEPEAEESLKGPETSASNGHSTRAPPTHRRESARARGRDNRRTSPHQVRRSYQQHQKPRHTKTPHLDNLERQRDLKPTEPNSYVFFSSSKPTTTTGSQRIGSRGLASGMTTTLSSIRAGEYKPLALIDSYQYPPILSTRRGCPPYQPPQTGTLSIMASNDTSAFYTRSSDLYYTSNIDSIKDDAICYEPGHSLIAPPKKSKYKTDYLGDSASDDDTGRRRKSSGGLCCCPCLRPVRSRRRTSNLSGHKEDLAERSKCLHCQEMFIHELNKPGSCGEAPDKCLHNINKVTCMCCAKSVFYHCCRDDEGDYDDEPCSCASRGGGGTKLARRWSTLAALSIIFPCLCLYPPLKACHSCGVACHCCGGKHQAQNASTKSRAKQKHPRRWCEKRRKPHQISLWASCRVMNFVTWNKCSVQSISCLWNVCKQRKRG